MISHLSLSIGRCLGASCCLAILALAGCRQQTTAAGAPPPPEVVVTWTRPVERAFTPFEEFTGHIEALESVQVRARVSGYLDEILFEDGAEVQEGQELFLLERDIFDAEAAKAEGVLQQMESRLARVTSQYDRSLTLFKNNSITTDEFERVQADKKDADAAVVVAKAALKLTKLDVAFTTVKAPITGRISRRAVDKGNLIKSDDTLLATIVQVDPIYAVFEIDERTALRKRPSESSQRAIPLAEQKIEVELFLIDQSRAPIKAMVDFSDNELDPGTGTLRVRAKVENRNLLLSPGFFVRCRMPMGDPKRPEKRLCVPEESLGSDQGQRFVYVYKGDKKIEDRRVKIGPLLDGWRVIEENIKDDEQVIVSGLQRVRPGDNAKITFKEEPKYASASSQSVAQSPSPKQAARSSPKAASE